ncbi:MAG: DUF4190 domain-containing protein [Lapillicoccus sp.]
MSSDPSHPQDRPAAPPTEPVPQAPPYARPPEQAYPQQPYAQQPYAPTQAPYQGYQPYAPAPDGRIAFQPPGPAVEHPQATLAFVLGLLSILGLLILGPFGWYFGRKVIREIDHDPRTFSNRGLAMAGMVLGIVATAFMALLAVLFGVGIVLVMAGSSR